MPHTTLNRTRKTHIGLALIALGTVMILANVGVVANFIDSLSTQAIGTPAAASLAILRVLHEVAFNPAAKARRSGQPKRAGQATARK